MPAPVRVLLADDHPVWRRGIHALLDAEADISVVAEAADGVEALRLIREGNVDVALIDMEMPGLSGVEVARTAKEEQLPVRILALSSYDDAAYVSGLLKNGAAGYLTKGCGEDHLRDRVYQEAIAFTKTWRRLDPAAFLD